MLGSTRDRRSRRPHSRSRCTRGHRDRSRYHRSTWYRRHSRCTRHHSGRCRHSRRHHSQRYRHRGMESTRGHSHRSRHRSDSDRKQLCGRRSNRHLKYRRSFHRRSHLKCHHPRSRHHPFHFQFQFHHRFRRCRLLVSKYPSRRRKPERSSVQHVGSSGWPSHTRSSRLRLRCRPHTPSLLHNPKGTGSSLLLGLYLARSRRQTHRSAAHS